MALLVQCTQNEAIVMNRMFGFINSTISEMKILTVGNPVKVNG